MIPLPLQPKISDKKDNKATFQIEAIYPGYGVTIGNSLRRVLFSSLPGAAITQFKIKGVQHEFSTLPGVMEDILTIMLNLKQLRFKVFSDEPQRAILKVKGEKKITAADFKLPSQIEIVNKNVHIATLTTKSAELDMEIQVEKGVGYSLKDSRKKEKLGIGEIALDAIFTPIRKASYRVENMRVGERTDFDRLFLDIETDGTIAPEEALLQSSRILINHFSIINDWAEKLEKPKTAKKRDESEDASKIKVEDLKLSTRTLNALTDSNIKTISGLIKKSEKSILALEGMGEKGVKEIKRKLKKFGLELK